MEFEFRETLLYVENLSVVYDDVTIIKDVSLIEKNVVRSKHDNNKLLLLLEDLDAENHIFLKH
jgi:hypothetical protein